MSEDQCYEALRRLANAVRSLDWAVEDYESRQVYSAERNMSWAETWLTMTESMLR